MSWNVNFQGLPKERSVHERSPVPTNIQRSFEWQWCLWIGSGWWFESCRVRSCDRQSWCINSAREIFTSLKSYYRRWRGDPFEPVSVCVSFQVNKSFDFIFSLALFLFICFFSLTPMNFKYICQYLIPTNFANQKKNKNGIALEITRPIYFLFLS